MRIALPFLVTLLVFSSFAHAKTKIISPLDSNPELIGYLEPLLEKSIWSEHRVVGPDMDLLQVTVFMLANAPQTKVWEVLTDYDNYAKLSDKVVECKVEKVGIKRFRAKIEVEAPLSNVMFEQEHKWEPPNRIRIRPMKSEQSRTYGIWPPE